MKKLATLLTLMAGVGFALGQGTLVNFNNNGVASGGDHKVYFDTVGVLPAVTGTNLSAELFYADPVSGVMTPFAASISKFRVATTAVPGTWSGKTVTLPAGTPLIGGSILLEVVVWDPNLNPSQDLVNGLGFFGRSGQFLYNWHDNAPNPALTTDTQLVTLPAFAISQVPEPSAIALSVIGVAGLLFLRRRK